MPTLNAKIWMALKSGIDGIVMGAIPWPIAWPASSYEPSSGTPFLAVGNVEASPRIAMMDGTNMRAGTVTISAVMPIGHDAAVYADAAGKIIEHMQGCLQYRDAIVRLTSDGGNTAYAAGGYRDGGWWREPVVIPWRVYA